MNRNSLGNLYIVATPIGNLGDMTPRAIEILKSVQCIAVEDTRHSGPLLQHFLIRTPAVSLHEHNERERAASLLERLQQGESVALISDAGTPLISDPGYFLVREARSHGVKVIPIPGASAVITALCASGLPTDRFTYEGFLPAKTKHKTEKLQALVRETRTMVFYESPHRVLDTLETMEKVFGTERQAVLARELTKLYETIQSLPLGELVAWVRDDENQQRGEIVLIIEGSQESTEEGNSISADAVLKILLADLPVKQASELAAKITGKRKNELYQQALKLKT